MNDMNVVRHENRKQMVGDSTLKLDENYDFHIKGVRYKEAPGLYERLFIKQSGRQTHGHQCAQEKLFSQRMDE